MELTILDKAQAWASNPYFDEQSRHEIQELINKGDEKELTERFYKDLEFGTGGMRSILGQGLNRINKYTIRKASQALANEVLRAGKEAGKTEFKIALSYDSRRMSFEFAQEAASVFAGNGIHAYIYKRLNPVALLSFSVRHHNACAGVMVTASHNPPEYNGFKVYWNDGAQVTPPNDKNIINNYYAINDFSTIQFLDFEAGLAKNLIHWVGEDVENAYYKAIHDKVILPELCQKEGSKLKIVYTPIHGTGLIPCTRALTDMGMTNIEVVEEQAKPDSNFPTVSSPNPENPSALKMAVDLMEKTNADIVMGSDPDTDRLGVALKHNGEIHYINGNQIGILMLHYVAKNLKETNRLPSNPYFVKTIVTTPLQDKIATSFGVETFNTLTGFKWICGLMNKLEKTNPEKNFIFATEESFGYLPNNYVRDKDGVHSVTLMAEMALYYKTKGLNLMEALDKIYEEYGFSHESLLNLVYEGKEGSEKISRIMESFRKMNDGQFAGLSVDYLEDYQVSNVVSFTKNESWKLDLPSSNVLGFNLVDGDKIYLRPSGTEPKIKFYIMIQENEGSLEQKKAKAQEKTDKILAFIKDMANKA
ncbi:putative phosphoglucomutase [Bacteriovorax sp. BSW11_IV]|uniref:phospho-sugar mutase n=1 Tax=Bacteriovorax sp. BSW11_IV TaxID=1353529 RepID=UPI00038A35EE|nr:phospho-sugar mutase [Bacteriovorax sp. BSW11_IV]EQC44595.1 putative phosphoglucomutase [Bacteriovorax sp. BSW11_IV]